VIDRIPIRVRPMLALLVPTPFHRPGWVFEEKYDGIRMLAYKEGAKVTLRSRNELDRTATFADIATAVCQLRDRTLVLDGEVVAFDSKGVSRFQLLQRGDIQQHFAIFDCVYRNGRNLRSEPLSRRRHELEETLREPLGNLCTSVSVLV
jgi:bifunctional non-homologous end joining protein LigD